MGRRRRTNERCREPLRLFGRTVWWTLHSSFPSCVCVSRKSRGLRSSFSMVKCESVSMSTTTTTIEWMNEWINLLPIPHCCCLSLLQMNRPFKHSMETVDSIESTSDTMETYSWWFHYLTIHSCENGDHYVLGRILFIFKCSIFDHLFILYIFTWVIYIYI